VKTSGLYADDLALVPAAATAVLVPATATAVLVVPAVTRAILMVEVVALSETGEDDATGATATEETLVVHDAEEATADVLLALLTGSTTTEDTLPFVHDAEETAADVLPALLTGATDLVDATGMIVTVMAGPVGRGKVKVIVDWLAEQAVQTVSVVVQPEGTPLLFVGHANEVVAETGTVVVSV